MVCVAVARADSPGAETNTGGTEVTEEVVPTEDEWCDMSGDAITTAFRSLIFLFGLSNVLHMIYGGILKRARAREKSDTAHTYFYVHPWSTQALQCPARLVRSTAPTCARPPAHSRTHSHVLPMLHPDAAHTHLSRLVLRK